MRPIRDFLLELAKHNIKVTGENGNLKINAPKGAMTEVIKEELKARKAELLSLLAISTVSGESTEPPISKAPPGSDTKLSFAQSRMWFLYQMEKDSSAYNIASPLMLTGALDVKAFSSAGEHIYRRHHVLRATFHTHKGEPTQTIHADRKLNPPLIDLEGIPSKSRKENLVRELIRQDVHASFDLERGPLVRFSLIRLDGATHVLLINMHHIISDGWSIGVMVRELATDYGNLVNDRPSRLPKLPIQYYDFAHWQRGRLGDKGLQKQLDYWTEKLADTPALLELPTDFPRPPVQTFNGAMAPFMIDAATANLLKALSRREGGSLFMMLLSIYQVMLARYSGQSDIAVGSPIANRNRAETEALIGYFANTLVLRGNLNGNPSLLKFLARTREMCLSAFANQDLPFERLVEALQPERSMSHSPIFQVMFSLQNTPGGGLELPGLKLGSVGSERVTAKFDLTLSMSETPHGLSGMLEYNTDLFSRETAQNMARHLRRLLTAAAENPDSPIDAMAMLDQVERGRILGEWCGPTPTQKSPQSILAAFEAQVRRHPEKPALEVVDDQGHLTRSISYGDLHKRVEQLASQLKKTGVTRDSVVGVYGHRGVGPVIALLAILKQGGVYLPLDPAYPRERLNYMMTDAQPAVLVGASDDLEWGLPLIDPDQLEAISPADDTPPPPAPHDPAYMIYTSGSTGHPKGVVVDHQAINRHSSNCLDDYDLNETDRVLQFASLSFDTSLEQLLPALSTGAMVIMRGGDPWPARQFAAVLRRCHLSVTNLPTAYWLQLVQEWTDHPADKPDAPAWRLLIVGGEALPPSCLEPWSKLQLKPILINAYGPTETTITATLHQVAEREPHANTPIGRPGANRTVYVLDQALQLVPAGVPGALYLGGECLARGYFKRPELTAERFIPDPYAKREGARLYASGDLVRFLPNGLLAFHGRIDHQVKLRGFRVEPGEIEAALAKHESVKEAVVQVREDQPGMPRLVAYIRAGENPNLPVQLKDHLNELLPDYMVPSIYIVLETFPMTPSGKIDRRALPKPDDSMDASHFVAPRDHVEEALADIWRDVLKRDRVGIHQNFFDLGGHSLLATQVVSRIRSHFQIELPLRAMFASPTVAELAVKLKAARTEDQAAMRIEPTPRDRPLPLSFAQQRLWFLDQLEPESAFYNIPNTVRLRGEFDVAAMSRALTAIAERHESLRTTFHSEAGKPVQVISPEPNFPIILVDISGIDVSTRKALGVQITRREVRRPFPLETGPLIRPIFIREAPEHHILALSIHHIISDGWSSQVFTREITALYTAFSNGFPSPLENLRIQYADFAVWQRNWLEGGVLEKQLNFWRDQLSGAAHVLELPTDHPRPPMELYNGASMSGPLPEMAGLGIDKLAREAGATPFMVLLAIYNILLSRYSGQKDILVGSPIANRRGLDQENLIGFFANTLVFRTQIDERLNFKDLLAKVKETALDAFSHQDVPFETLVDFLQVKRDMSRAPLFQVLFVLQNAPRQEIPVGSGNLRLEPVRVDAGIAKFDLTLFMWEVGGRYVYNLEYNTDIFLEETAARMITHFRTLVQNIVANPEQPLYKLNVMDEAERDKLLGAWNDTERNLDIQQDFKQRIEAQAAVNPDATALVHHERRLSYAAMNQRANQLAGALQESGVGPESVVGVMLDRDLDMALGFLAVLKTGAAVVALDPAYPKQRLRFIIKDAGLAALLTTEHYADLADQVPILTPRSTSSDGGESRNPDVAVSPQNLLYVIYTSGSTGQPKGVGVPREALLNLLAWQRESAGLKGSGATLQFAAFGFCVSFQEMLSSWSAGGRLVIAGEDERRDMEALAAYIGDQGITCLHLPFAALKQLAATALNTPHPPTRLRDVITAGEQLQVTETIRAWFQTLPGCRLHNQYGASETHVISALTLRDKPDRWMQLPSAGRPVANVRIYLLDKHLQPVPTGTPGEVYAAGACLARGYLNQVALTAEKLVPDPFSDAPGGRLYRTGDLARFRGNGYLQYLGRADEMVKVRGYRVEPGEIEAALRQHESIRDIAVIPHKTKHGDYQLAAYAVPNEKATIDAAELRRYLGAKLPPFMVPQTFMTLAELPMTTHGKLDREALPKPETGRDAARAPFVAPESTMERELAAIWSEVLGIEKIGVHDDFFELGGHSLLATQVMSRVQQHFQTDMPLRALFEEPTIEGLVRRLGTAGPAAALPPITPIPRKAHIPLSFAQQRLWFLDQLEGPSGGYNMPTALYLEGHTDLGALDACVTQILTRHESLRTTFDSYNDQAHQIIHPPHTASLPLINLQGLEHAGKQQLVRQLIEREAAAPFNLARGPLLRVQLLRVEHDGHILMVTMHHIVSDGWSTGVVVRELAVLYKGVIAGTAANLPPLPIQYADFAVWQRERVNDEALKAQADYWRNRLSGIPPLLELPTDRPRPPVQTYNGAAVPFSLDAGLSQQLGLLGRRQRATLFMTIQAGLAILLSRHSGQRDIVIGTPVANRNRAELEPLIGFFVNTLAMRCDLSDNPPFSSFLNRIRQDALDAYAHQDIPFEQVVEIVKPVRDLSHAPLFQVMFSLQNTPSSSFDLPGLRLGAMGREGIVAKFDLTLNLSESERGLIGSFEYNTDLFNALSIKRMSDHLVNLLSAIADSPASPVFALTMLDSAERNRLLVEWNQSQTEVPHDQPVHVLVSRYAQQAPSDIAVVHDGKTITYGELNRQADLLAHYMRHVGVGRGHLVGVCMNHSIELNVALLAAFKVGAAYVPISPTYPKARMDFMQADADWSLLLSHEPCRETLPTPATPIYFVELKADAPEDEFIADVGLEEPAYIIYTSGSTGQPKGVTVSHGCLLNFTDWVLNQVQLTDKDKTTQISNTAFDGFLLEVWPSLMVGAEIHIPPKHALESPHGLQSWYQEAEITFSHLPTPLAEGLLSLDWTGRRNPRILMTGGDRLTRRPKANAPFDFINNYGPTETTVVASSTIIEPEDDGSMPPIGTPTQNTKLYVLNHHLALTPQGSSGELFIGGTGVAFGYRRRPDMTAARFIPDPFSQIPGARLYQTGDLVRYREDGQLRFLGRLDHQVKIRGFRIELGEIESVLVTHPKIQQAVAKTWGQTGDQRLAAYVVTNTGDTILSSELRESLLKHLKAQLPDYMIPSAIVSLERFPYTANGKVKRAALPEPDKAHFGLANEAEAARDHIELGLTAIWESLLQVQPIGISDNFFEIGGHSILAVRLMSQIQQRFGKALPLAVLFQRPTIALLAEEIRREGDFVEKSPLVLLHKGAGEGNLFMLHPVGGNVMCYLPLSRELPANWNIYGLQSPGLYDAPQPRSIETMAALYLERMREVQPKGPYYLLGWSTGGLIAFEAARLLLEQGEAVARLILMDSHLLFKRFKKPDDIDLVPHFLHDLMGLAGQMGDVQPILNDDLKSIDWAATVGLLVEKAILPAEVSADRLEKLWRVYKVNFDATLAYKPKRYKEVVYFIRPEGDIGAEKPYDPIEDWIKQTKCRIEQHPAKGSHHGMLRSPNVAALGKIITRLIGGA